ncbi:hypothetical protein Vi05172_g2664 [Venturia inaequalis]|nr:hypothetical protein Vi05172_g2664 [Venturia inaequalis]
MRFTLFFLTVLVAAHGPEEMATMTTSSTNSTGAITSQVSSATSALASATKSIGSSAVASASAAKGSVASKAGAPQQTGAPFIGLGALAGAGLAFAGLL